MSKNLYMYVGIDVDPSIEVPTIENQKDKLCEALRVIPPEPIEDPEDEESKKLDTTQPTVGRVNGSGRGRGKGGIRRRAPNTHNQVKPEQQVFTEFHSKWVDFMSFSHNCASQDSTTYLGSMNITKFTSELTPVMNYFSQKKMRVPVLVLRPILLKEENVLTVSEYELLQVNIESVSVSGGSGGKPVETLSLQPTFYIHKYYRIDITTGEYLTKNISKYDKETLKGMRSTTNELLQVVDDNNEASVQLAKDLGVIGAYTPTVSKTLYVGINDIYAKKVRISKTTTLDQLKTIVAEKLGKQPSDVQGLYTDLHDGYVLIEKVDDLEERSKLYLMIDGDIIGRTQYEIAKKADAGVPGADKKGQANVDDFGLFD
ncbi:hypothetical protein DFA_04419 [Cavenderia fasciculata]|uniref:Uncharacterized protein n=1 Tax=Cavenderia fasciculata TaxID=261658 RepID=F4PPI8_CACFS|nr:uncharacterized protein DFA_04419 [Cavenderia fasciculata]EGG22301.1 hypothetical protein DFA_04419 [Cavenderia fasciculata]|eukprot:XP_004360152.1 hypothetical protein DFA_04419 [Cavenderia fasciculata]